MFSILSLFFVCPVSHPTRRVKWTFFVVVFGILWKVENKMHFSPAFFFVGLHTFLASTFINWFASFCYWAIRFFASAVYPSVWLRSMQNVNIVMANSQIYIELKEQQNEPKKISSDWN